MMEFKHRSATSGAANSKRDVDDRRMEGRVESEVERP